MGTPFARQVDGSCTGRRWCGNWKTCPRCAAARARLWADRAEALEQRAGRLDFARITPAENTAAAVREIRDRILRSKLAPAGIWSVEAGSLFAALHLHMLVPHDSALRESGLAQYIEPVRTCARVAAAYMVDRAGAPSAKQYSGRLVGQWGRFTETLMASRDPAHAAAQAAAVNGALLSDAEKAERAQGWYRVQGGYVKGEPERPERTKAEYAEIARRNLSKLYASMQANCRNITTV